MSVKPKLIVPHLNKSYSMYGDLSNFKSKLVESDPVGDIPKTKLQLEELTELGLHKDWDKALGLKEIQLDILCDMCYISYDIIVAERTGGPFSFKKQRYLTCSRFSKYDSSRLIYLYLNGYDDIKKDYHDLILTSSYRGVSMKTALESGCVSLKQLGKTATYHPSFVYIPYFTEVLDASNHVVDVDEPTISTQGATFGSFDSMLGGLDF